MGTVIFILRIFIIIHIYIIILLIVLDVDMEEPDINKPANSISPLTPASGPEDMSPPGSARGGTTGRGGRHGRWVK